MSAIIGNFADVESVVSLKDLLNRFDCDNFEVRSDAPKLSADLRASYVMNSRITGTEDADLILLVGVNPRTDAPVFNARILKAVKRGAKVFVVGSGMDLGYEYTHLGTTTRTLVEIAEGKNPFCARLMNAKLPMVIVGARSLEREDGQAILDAAKTISKNSSVLNESQGWNGFNVLHHEGSRVGALDVGISSTVTPGFKPKLVYILGADNIRTEDIPSDAFVIYQGTHGDEGAYFADLILPGAAYTEKTATFVNTEGRVQVSRLVVQPPGVAKEDWKIIRALSEECGQALPYDNHEELRYRIAELAPHLLKYDFIEGSLFSSLALDVNSGSDLIISPINDTIDVYLLSLRTIIRQTRSRDPVW